MSEQKIKFTNKIKTPFTWVENDLIRSKSLSAEEIGLYVILRSFGEYIYPSADYLSDLARMGKKKLYKTIKALINAKLLIRKQTKKSNNKVFSNIEYIILSPNDNYEEIYKKFTGKEPKNLQTLDDSQSEPCGHLRHALTRHALNDRYNKNNRIDKEESLYEKESHTKEKKKGVCENEIQKIQKLKTFQNSETGLIKNLINKNGKEAIIAAEYIEKVFSGRAVRNPPGLLISTLKRGTYSELPPEKVNNLNSEMGKINAEYKGFIVFRNEKIKEILNIGGKIAFYTDNCLRELKYTPAKSYEEFKIILKKINSS
jgi:hypothetical protein